MSVIVSVIVRVSVIVSVMVIFRVSVIVSVIVIMRVIEGMRERTQLNTY